MTAAITDLPGPGADVLARAAHAANAALVCEPGPLGELAHRELKAWRELGHRFDHSGWGLALICDIEARHRALTLGRTYA